METIMQPAAKLAVIPRRGSQRRGRLQGALGCMVVGGLSRIRSYFSRVEPRKIALGDDDGIVNTASMLWPNQEETMLVDGDHMDIVGHYKRVPAIKGSGRVFQAYDLLRSNSGFTSATFDRIWTGIFDFSVPANTAQAGD